MGGNGEGELGLFPSRYREIDTYTVTSGIERYKSVLGDNRRFTYQHLR